MKKITLLNPQQAQEPFLKNEGWSNTASCFIHGVTDDLDIILLNAVTFKETIDSNSLRVKFGTSEYVIPLDTYGQEITLELKSFEDLGVLLLINAQPYLLRVYRATGQKSIQQIGARFPDICIVDFVNRKNLTDLSPLSGLHALTDLNLGGCENLTDLSPISGLHSLTNLNLLGCENLTDLSPLSGLHALINLNLARCFNITNLTPLSGLHVLTNLNFYWCRNLTDLSPLSGLHALTNLNLESCRNLTDLSPISGLHALTNLNLTHCINITNMTPLSGLQALTNLNIGSSGKLTDLSPICGLHALTNLNLESCRNLTDLSPLSGLHALTNLNLESCRNLTDLSPLSGLHALTNLNLTWCSNLTDLSPISGLHALTNLNLERCSNLTDLSPLSGLHALTNLDLSWCKNLTDLSPLSGLHALTYLKVGDCSKLTDLSPLSGLHALTNLNLTWCNKLTELNPISGLHALTNLNLGSCSNLTDLSPLSGLHALTNLNLTWCSNLTDLNPISGLHALTYLNLSSCENLTDLSPLSCLHALTNLDLGSCYNLTVLSPISGLHALTNLDLSSCENLTDLSPIKGLHAIKNLNLNNVKNITKIEAILKLENLENLDLKDCPNIRDFKKLESLVRLRKLEWIDPLACSEVLMSIAFNQQDISFIASDLNQWIQELLLSKDAVLFSSLLLNCISSIEPITRKTHLAAVSTAMRKRGIESESSNDLDAFTWDTWCNLVLDLDADEAFACFELAVNELNIPRETGVILGPVVIAASEFIQKYPSEKVKTVHWVNEQLNQLESFPQETRQIAPSAAVFFASLNQKEEVLYWLQKATDEKAPLWREHVILALINYYANVGNFSEARRLLDEMQIQEEKDKAIASLAQVMAANFPIEAGFLLDDIEQTSISTATALNLLQQPAMLREPQGIYQLLLHLQSNPDELASTIEIMIQQDTEGKVASSLKQLFVEPQASGPSATVLLELCKHPAISNYVKPRALEKYKAQLHERLDLEKTVSVAHLIDEMLQENMIDEEEAHELTQQILNT
jgi:pentatricopeptide repeat protein